MRRSGGTQFRGGSSLEGINIGIGYIYADVEDIYTDIEDLYTDSDKNVKALHDEQSCQTYIKNNIVEYIMWERGFAFGLVRAADEATARRQLLTVNGSFRCQGKRSTNTRRNGYSYQ